MPVKKVRDVFRAISDPRRRALIETLVAKKSIDIAELRMLFNDIRASAIYEHLQILNECKLLKVSKKKGVKYYSFNKSKLNGELNGWLLRLRKKNKDH